jgi:hypothetical protein
MINSKKSPLSNLCKYVFALTLVLAIYFVRNPMNAQPLQGGVTEKKVKDTLELKAFEGYYQFQNDKDVFLQITAKGNNLILKQLWDGEEIVFVRKSELEFFNEEKSFPLKFSKDKNGVITQVLAFDRDLWNKVKDYKPVIKKEIQLTPQQLKAFEGKYRFQFEKGKDDFLQITAMENHLVLKQLWDGKEINFVPESELDFFCKDQSFPLKFIKDKNGSIIQMLAFNRDLWEKVKE